MYSLKIIAADAGMPALTSTVDVTVELLDVNDNPPQFSNSNFTATVEVSWHSRYISTALLLHIY